MLNLLNTHCKIIFLHPTVKNIKCLKLSDESNGELRIFFGPKKSSAVFYVIGKIFDANRNTRQKHKLLQLLKM